MDDHCISLEKDIFHEHVTGLFFKADSKIAYYPHNGDHKNTTMCCLVNSQYSSIYLVVVYVYGYLVNRADREVNKGYT